MTGGGLGVAEKKESALKEETSGEKREKNDEELGQRPIERSAMLVP